jgi:putative redox protein
MTFTGTADSGFKVPLGTDPDVGGDEDGFRPMELIAIGLAGCTAMDVISIMQKKRQKVDAFEVRIHAERAQEHPRVFTDIEVEYIVHGENVQEEALRRSIELSETKYCPAQAMLRQAVSISTIYNIVES